MNSALIAGAGLIVIALLAAFVFASKRGAGKVAPPATKSGMTSAKTSAANLKALEIDPNKPSIRILYGTQVSGSGVHRMGMHEICPVSSIRASA